MTVRESGQQILTKKYFQIQSVQKQRAPNYRKPQKIRAYPSPFWLFHHFSLCCEKKRHCFWPSFRIVPSFKPGQSREHTWSCRVRHGIDQGRAVMVSTKGRPSRQSGGPHVWREGSIQYGCVICPRHCKNPNKQKWFSMRPGLWVSMHCRLIWQTT